MAITRLPPLSRPCASQMNLRLEAHATSRTLAALKCQVFIPAALPFSAASASCGVITSSGVLLFFARARRSRCAAFNTAAGFCSSPVAATTWSDGTVRYSS
ncbi:hypothetical protein D3C72_1701330 [compost metagenome]